MLSTATLRLTRSAAELIEIGLIAIARCYKYSYHVIATTVYVLMMSLIY